MTYQTAPLMMTSSDFMQNFSNMKLCSNNEVTVTVKDSNLP